MHTLRIPLKTTLSDDAEIEHRFWAISRIHNATVHYAKELLKRLDSSKEYQSLMDKYVELLKKPELTAEEKRQKTELSRQMTEHRRSIGLTKYDIMTYAAAYRKKKFSKRISSQQAQKEGVRVYNSVERFLFGNGRTVHYKKLEQFSTISGESNKNGARFSRDTFTVAWIGLELRCKLPKKQKELEYVYESIGDNEIKYCDIERLMFPNGWHYYVKLYLSGDPPKKNRHTGTGTMGIDPGVSTIAAVSEDMVALEELAPQNRIYAKRIVKLQRRMDRSKRDLNPQKYNEDGTIKKGNRGPWKFSNTYIKNKRKLKSLYRQKAAYTKQSHEILCNRLLENAVFFYVEDMTYKSLQRKAKKTERSDVLTEVKQKDGTTKTVRKYKRKKRFGRSLNSRAPAEFLAILKRKAELHGGKVVAVNTREYRASQYNHVTDIYVKVPLKQRFKDVGGRAVQRDLYSAFLIRNADRDLRHPDRDRCVYEFEKFVSMQDCLISDMRERGISMKQCFGF